MVHPMVEQLRFTRSEFRRGLVGLTDEEARRRFLPMNCISWNIGHLAWQEQRYWLTWGMGQVLRPDVQELFAYGAPASTPGLAEMWAAWETITETADSWLDTVTTEMLAGRLIVDGQPSKALLGSLLYRMIYHYWYHAGENLAIRQMLGHRDLPQFVGRIDKEAPYKAERNG